MKAVILKTDLISHRKCLLIMKPSKKLAESAMVTLTASDRLCVTGPGFSQDLDCRSEKWGTVSLPFNLWNRIVDKLIPFLPEEEITIFDSTGLAIQDLACAKFVYEKAITGDLPTFEIL